MRTRSQRLLRVTAVVAAMVAAAFFFAPRGLDRRVIAQVTPTPAPVASPAAPAFDQKAALAKLREQIKGHEQEPATSVWKNLKTPFLMASPAGRVLAVMEVAYARSIGVDCTHCHVPDKWDSDDKPQKQITRDMAAMMGKINTELLTGIKNLKSERPTVNCTTCHRGQTKPATNLPSS